MLKLCKHLRHYVKSKIGHGLTHMEHFIYGVTYLLIGFTHLEWLYYAFGTFVFVCIAFGDDSSSNGGEL